jgi:rhodanese-related sulfurtransferase
MHPVADPQSLPEHPAWRAGNVLDVRPADDYLRGHVAPAVSLPLPGAADALPAPDLLEKYLPSILLPPHGEPLLVVAATVAVAESLCAWLRARGRGDVTPCLLDAAGLASLPAEALATGPCRRHLWRPPSFLAGHVQRLPPPVAGPVLELGSGSCRAAVWLAERGWRVTAVDRDARALELGRCLAADLGVRITTLQRDLRDPGQVPPGPWAAVLAFRFLRRELLRALPQLLQPHGVVVVRTFRADAGAGGVGPRRPHHRLASGELLRLFPPELYDVLVHEQDHDPDGLPMAGIVARWRPARF